VAAVVLNRGLVLPGRILEHLAWAVPRRLTDRAAEVIGVVIAVFAAIPAAAEEVLHTQIRC